MSRIKKIIRNIFIIVILSFFIITRLGLHFTPLSAHESSERGANYGPSEVIHIEDFENGKYILGKYDKWISCDTVNQALLFFWRAGNQPVGFENDKTKKVSYSWSLSSYYFKAYGIVNDKDVKKIEITLSNGDILTQTDFYEDLFLLTCKAKEKGNIHFKAIRGYDADNNIVFAEEY